MADNEVDELYAVRPDEFTALRTRLAAAAKKRGDAAAAKRISAARKPTTAAWIVNQLARGNKKATHRMTDLGQRLREAHAAMNGDRIRELSAEQRELVDELVRAAFQTSELSDPPAALRDDVTGTLQAAIADPDVAGRLGRLAKAERWSGFGEFGDTATVFTSARGGKPKVEPKQERQKDTEDSRRDKSHAAARKELESARATVATAERAKSATDEALSERQAELAQARLRHDDARKRFQEAERKLQAAEDDYGNAKEASRDAAALVKEAKARLKQFGGGTLS
jgi:hypothetical protein